MQSNYFHCCYFLSDCWCGYFFIRREDRTSNKHSRICSCHFRDGDKRNGPEISENNRHKIMDLLPGADPKPPPKKKEKKVSSSPKATIPTVTAILEELKENSGAITVAEQDQELNKSRDAAILEIELDIASRELMQHQDIASYRKGHYSASNLSTDVIRMETGLPTREVFTIVVNYISRFKDSINYYAGWKVENIRGPGVSNSNEAETELYEPSSSTIVFMQCCNCGKYPDICSCTSLLFI